MAFILVVCWNARVEAQQRTVTVKQDVLGAIEIVAPQAEPSRFVIFISDHDGLTPPRFLEAQKLTDRGAAVALIDLPKLQATFAKRVDDDCYYVFGEFEDLARMAQKQLNVSDWKWPELLGVGDGGTLAYLSLAQAPSNTAGGAVSIGFSPTFSGKVPLCAGAGELSRKNGVVAYSPMTELPASWALVLPDAPSKEVASFVGASKEASVRVVGVDAERQFDEAVSLLFNMKPKVSGGLSDLPITELPASGPSSTLLILLSGDGGWRDIDKQIGEYLAAHGVSVIGLDSLRYFWRRKEAKTIAADIERIADHYLEKWNLQSLALAGYSFGADVLPMTWSELEPITKSRTRLIALLGAEPTFDLEVSVSGWLGVAASTNIDIRPFLSSLPSDKVMCFYGVDEKQDGSTACTLPELKGASLIERPGGHHFDGNYEVLAEEILQRLNGKDARR